MIKDAEIPEANIIEETSKEVYSNVIKKLNKDVKSRSFEFRLNIILPDSLGANYEGVYSNLAQLIVNTLQAGINLKQPGNENLDLPIRFSISKIHSRFNNEETGKLETMPVAFIDSATFELWKTLELRGIPSNTVEDFVLVVKEDGEFLNNDEYDYITNPFEVVKQPDSNVRRVAVKFAIKTEEIKTLNSAIEQIYLLLDGEKPLPGFYEAIVLLEVVDKEDSFDESLEHDKEDKCGECDPNCACKVENLKSIIFPQNENNPRLILQVGSKVKNKLRDKFDIAKIIDIDDADYEEEGNNTLIILEYEESEEIVDVLYKKFIIDYEPLSL